MKYLKYVFQNIIEILLRKLIALPGPTNARVIKIYQHVAATPLLPYCFMTLGWCITVSVHKAITFTNLLVHGSILILPIYMAH